MNAIEKLIASNAPSSSILKDLINDNRVESMRLAALYEEYKGEVSIKDRVLDDPLKVNNQLANDYRGQIIDSAVGYMFGNPISYNINEEGYSKAEYERYDNIIQDFVTRNSIDDLDSKTGKLAAICGYSGRLLYIDKNGDERVISIPAWECIFVDNGSTGEPQYALRHYTVEVEDNYGTVERTKIEFYDDTYVTTYLQNSGGEYDLIEAPKPHMFDGVPLVKFINNDELQGDFEKVSSLIDAYDLMLSDVQNEIEEFRNAYMIFEGATIDSDFLQAAKQTGAIELPEGAKASFLTKEIADTIIENQKKTLNENIYKFSSSVDFGENKFADASGESRKWKLLAMENKAITKERKFSAGLRQMFKVLATAWQKKGYNIDYLDIYWHFTRSLPVDLQHYTAVAKDLRGHISEKTRLSLLPFVDDVEFELEEMKRDMGEQVILE